MFSHLKFALFFVIGAAFCLTNLFAQETYVEWKISPKASSVVNPQPNNAETIKAGAKVYAKECISCHGETGKGDGAGAKDFTTPMADFTKAKTQDQADGALYYKITKGRRPMPAYKDSLTDEERWNVVHYIRTLKAK